MGQNMARYELKEADVVIRPQVGNVSATRFQSRHDAIMEGEKAAQAALPPSAKHSQSCSQLIRNGNRGLASRLPHTGLHRRRLIDALPGRTLTPSQHGGIEKIKITSHGRMQRLEQRLLGRKDQGHLFRPGKELNQPDAAALMR